MIFLVDDKEWDLTDLTIEKQRQLFRDWKKRKSKIECYCIPNRNIHPPLHVNEKKLNDGKYNYWLSNNPKHNVPHEATCPKNLVFIDSMKKNGIEIDEHGIMTVKLTFKKPTKQSSNGTETISEREIGDPEQSTQRPPSSRLKTLFLALLQKDEVKAHIYLPNRKRDNISGRLEAAGYKSKVGKTFLNYRENSLYVKRMYVATIKRKDGKEYKFKIKNSVFEPDAPDLIIGWGTKNIKPEVNPFNKTKYDIPLYSVDEPQNHVTNMQVYKPIYDEALRRIENESVYNSVKTGYWVLYRERSRVGKYFEDKELLFIPAEPITRIPIESSYEEIMLKYLVELNRHFRKPLLGNEIAIDLGERPDFVLLDNYPNTIIEVAGLSSEDYVNRLGIKTKIYMDMGFSYIEWQAYEKEDIKTLGIENRN